VPFVKVNPYKDCALTSGRRKGLCDGECLTTSELAERRGGLCAGGGELIYGIDGI
jgi:hypothetical protein